MFSKFTENATFSSAFVQHSHSSGRSMSARDHGCRAHCIAWAWRHAPLHPWRIVSHTTMRGNRHLSDMTECHHSNTQPRPSPKRNTSVRCVPIRIGPRALGGLSAELAAALLTQDGKPLPLDWRASAAHIPHTCSAWRNPPLASCLPCSCLVCQAHRRLAHASQSHEALTKAHAG